MKATCFAIVLGRAGRIAAIAAATQARLAGGTVVDLYEGFQLELTVPVGPLGIVISDPTPVQLGMVIAGLLVFFYAWARIRRCLLEMARWSCMRVCAALGGEAIFRPVGGYGVFFEEEDSASAPLVAADTYVFAQPLHARTVATQSQTSYTFVRGAATPRFQPLPERDQGVFVDGLQAVSLFSPHAQSLPAGGVQ